MLQEIKPVADKKPQSTSVHFCSFRTVMKKKWKTVGRAGSLHYRHHLLFLQPTIKLNCSFLIIITRDEHWPKVGSQTRTVLYEPFTNCRKLLRNVTSQWTIKFASGISGMSQTPAAVFQWSHCFFRKQIFSPLVFSVSLISLSVIQPAHEEAFFHAFPCGQKGREKKILVLKGK